MPNFPVLPNSQTPASNSANAARVTGQPMQGGVKPNALSLMNQAAAAMDHPPAAMGSGESAAGNPPTQQPQAQSVPTVGGGQPPQAQAAATSNVNEYDPQALESAFNALNPNPKGAPGAIGAKYPATQ